MKGSRSSFPDGLAEPPSRRAQEGSMLDAFAGRLALAILGSVLFLAPTHSFAQEPIKIGFFGPITERFAGLGLDAKKGADLAIKQATAAGAGNGRPIPSWS